jgi:hypothetical protein
MEPRRVLGAALLVLTAWASSTAWAQSGPARPQTRAGGTISVGNGIGITLFGALMDDEVVRDGGLFDSGEFVRAYRGLDASGAPGETYFQSRIVARTRPLQFGASASLRLIEPRVNDANPPYVQTDAAGGYAGIDPNGLPNRYSASAFSYVADEVAVVSERPVSQVRVHLSVRGTIAPREDFPGDRASMAAVLYQSRGLWPDIPFFPELRSWSDPGAHAHELWTEPVPVVEGRFAFGLSLSSQIFTSLRSAEDETSEWSFGIDFLDGVTINYVQGFDSLGEPVTLTSATGAFGTRYPTAPVPEPGTFASILVGLGLVGAVFRGRIPARNTTASRG